MNFLTSFFLYLFIYSITISAAYWAEYSLKKWDSRLITVHDNVRKLHINGNAIKANKTATSFMIVFFPFPHFF